VTIEALIYTRLSGFAGLTALVGTRIYKNIAPQNTGRPYVTYRRVTATRPPAMGRNSGVVRARFQFDSFDEDFADASAVRAQILAAIERWRDAGPPVVQDIFPVNELDLYEDDIRLHHLSDDYEVNYRE
jgi:hypothetical protein